MVVQEDVQEVEDRFSLKILFKKGCCRQNFPWEKRPQPLEEPLERHLERPLEEALESVFKRLIAGLSLK